MMHFKAIFIFFLFLKLNFYAQPISELDSVQLYTTDLNYGNQKIKIKRDTLLKPALPILIYFLLGSMPGPKRLFYQRLIYPKQQVISFKILNETFQILLILHLAFTGLNRFK